MIRATTLTAILTAALALGACDKTPDTIGLKSAQIVVNPVPGRPASGYFTLVNGPTEQVLEYARVPLALRTEMHESMAEGGTMVMNPIDRVPIPAKGTLEFKPGGRHLMIYDLDPTAIKAGRTQIQLRFRDGAQIEYNAVVTVLGQAK